MKKHTGKVGMILCLLLIGQAAYGQGNRAEKTSEDWRHMLDAVEVSLPENLPPRDEDPRRPPHIYLSKESGNWTDSLGNHYTRGPWGKWVNYDESKANPFRRLPDPMILEDGRKVESRESWWTLRRPELKRAFAREIYGKVPENLPSVEWQVTERRDTTIAGLAATVKEVAGRVDNSSYPGISVTIELTVVTPRPATGSVPVIMHFGYRLPPRFRRPENPNLPNWRQQILAQGWGYAEYMPQSVQEDHGAGLTAGIIGLANRGLRRNPDDWGALRAWAWGASRSLDYLESDPDTDGSRVGIEGLSRLGKAVLVTMAFDERFAIALVGSSGKGGATLYRRNYGETLGVLASSSEYHWFNGNFIRYAAEEGAGELSVDAHQLIALCAPRPVFVSVGSPEQEGRWIDAPGQFMAAAAASPVYHFLGAGGLETDVMPPMGTALTRGELAFRQHFAGHTVTPNWPFFINYARRYFKP